jgi:hypothetical protein
MVKVVAFAQFKNNQPSSNLCGGALYGKPCYRQTGFSWSYGPGAANLASDPVKAAAAAVAGKIAAAMAGGSGDAGKGDATVLPLRSGA